MTIGAAACDRGVIETDRVPALGRDMATVALPVGGDVSGGLAGRRGAVVATRAGARYVDVVEAAGIPGHRGMTGLAGGTGRDMVRALAGGSDPIMAGGTVAGDPAVVEAHALPTAGRGMAVVAGRGGLYMFPSLTRRAHTIMAAGTGTDRHTVIEADPLPAVS